MQTQVQFENLDNKNQVKTSKILVFDIETQKGFDETRNIPDMRVAVAVSCDCLTGEYKCYTEENVNELIEELFSADTVIGYNIINFDYSVLKRYTDRDFSAIKTVDMMRIVQSSLGFRPKLDNLVTATLGASKTADGLQSLRWFKEGKIDKIIEYCHQDVKLTKELYEFGKTNGYIWANNRGSKEKVSIIW
jgi:DEAD/DEAH box helicase domain-containing protein